MAKLFFNYPLWDFSCFPLRHLLVASPIASATKSALFNKMASSRGGFMECQLELLTSVSAVLFIQTGLDWIKIKRKDQYWSKKKKKIKKSF